MPPIPLMFAAHATHGGASLPRRLRGHVYTVHNTVSTDEPEPVGEA